ncbi:hypothetical protein BJX61DRAFT_380687 [Aspergillus egyptiacus]|nr:hypothetical protein BJX61DRAFT_380687 [Aspergillus egyptiacus]
MSLPTEPLTWRKTTADKTFLLSTNNSLLSIPAINAAFDSDYMYWTKSYPEEVLQGIIDNSFCLGLYTVTTPHAPQDEAANESQNLEQIGFVRLITDRYTFAYMTDFYVVPEYQGYGLGGWMLEVLDELMKPLPHLRWFTLRTGSARSVEAYRARFGMEVLDNGDVGAGGVMMGIKGKANMA